jgi:hypothetical protein
MSQTYTHITFFPLIYHLILQFSVSSIFKENIFFCIHFYLHNIVKQSISYCVSRPEGGLECILWCLMPLSTIFQLHRGGQFY